jgi:hypothetical protein
MISALGVRVVDGAETSTTNEELFKKPFGTAGNYIAYTSGGGTSITLAVHAYVKVLNDQVTVIVKNANGDIIHESTTTITWSKTGTIAFTGLNMDHSVSNITLKVLDEQGNQVPVDTVPFIDSFNNKVDNSAVVTEGVYDFSEDNEANNAIRDAVNAKWNVYGGRDSVLHQFAPEEVGTDIIELDGADSEDPTKKDGYNTTIQLGATANGYNLNASSGSYDNLTMRSYLSLVPKNAAGNEIVAKNFEVSFKVNTQLRHSNGGFMLQFRAQDSGWAAFNDGGGKKPYGSSAKLFVSAYGAGIWDNTVDTESAWKKPSADNTLVTAYTSGGTTNGTVELDVTLRVVGSTVTAKVAIGGAVVYEDTKEVTWLKAGTIAFTGLNGNNVLSNVSLTLLDDNGEPVIPYTQKAEGGAIAVETVDKKGTTDVKQAVATVAAEAGKQLKAGTLKARVKGEDEYTILPTRVGFRDAANLQSNQFIFEGEGELEITAEFYTPASTAEANVAMIATSKPTTESGGDYGNAVRFISRSYIYEDGGKFYMDIAGAPMEVADFGMYVTSQMALDKAGYESIEDAIAEGTLRALVKRSIPAAGQEVGKLGIFYDYADGYVDTSIQIINIPSTHLEQQIVSCTYVEFANGDVFLTDAASRSHADA